MDPNQISGQEMLIEPQKHDPIYTEQMTTQEIANLERKKGFAQTDMEAAFEDASGLRYAINHKANIDEADEDEGISQIDFDEYAGVPEDLKKRQMERGKAINLEFYVAASEIQKKHPFARVKPKEIVPASNILKKNADVYKSHEPKFCPKKGAKEYLRNLNSNQKKNANDTDTINRIKEEREAMILEQEATSGIYNTSLELKNLFRTILVKPPKLEECRVIFKDHFYSPKNITKKAMSNVIYSATFNKGTSNYKLPITEMVKRQAELLGYSSIDEMELSIEKSAMLKVVSLLAKASGDGKFDQEFLSQQVREVKEILDTEAVGPGNNLAEGEEVEELDLSFLDIEKELKILGDIDKAFDEKHAVVPFKFNAPYTYRVLFYFYLNHHDGILPFGRTMPPLSWLYVVSYLFDPNNVLGLRYNIDEYSIKVGGVGILQKAAVQKNITDFNLGRIFSPIVSGQGNSRSLKGLIVSFLTITAKLQLKNKRLSQVKDELIYFFGELVERIAAQRNSLDQYPIHAKIEFSEIQANLELAMQCAQEKAVTQNFIKSLLNRFGVSIKENVLRASELSRLFSFEANLTAFTMKKYANLAEKNSRSGLGWFVNSFFVSNDEENSMFRILVSSFARADLEGVLIDLFEGKEHFRQVKRVVNKAKETIKNGNLNEIQKILSEEEREMYGIEWANAVNINILQSNAVFANQITESIFPDFKKEVQNVMDEITTKKRKPLLFQEEPLPELLEIENGIGSYIYTNIGTDEKKLEKAFSDKLALASKEEKEKYLKLIIYWAVKTYAGDDAAAMASTIYDTIDQNMDLSEVTQKVDEYIESIRNKLMSATQHMYRSVLKTAQSFLKQLI